MHFLDFVSLACMLFLAFLIALISLSFWLESNNVKATTANLIAQLAGAPTIPFTSLKHRPISGKGEIVLLQNSIVAPLDDKLRLFSSEYRREAVLIKRFEQTDETPEFKYVYSGHQDAMISRVPFVLVSENEYMNGKEGKDRFFVVVNANADNLPLMEEPWVRSPLVPSVFLTKKTTKSKYNSLMDIEANDNETMMMITDDCISDDETVTTKSTTIQVQKWTCDTFLASGTRLNNVFGKLRYSRNGYPVIEPCVDFPKSCFTMSRSNILEIGIDPKAKDRKAFIIRVFGIVFGILSVVFICVGVHDSCFE